MLEFSIAGLPDFRQQRLFTAQDGEVTLPVIGLVDAAGQSLTSPRAVVETELPRRAISVRTATGERQQTILMDEVTLLIAEYRPIYVKGDVAKPGEQQFRPGMTVRQAVAVAGGFEAMPLRGLNLRFIVPDLRGD